MDKILLGHGSGGRLMHELIRSCFAPTFDLKSLGDSALIDINLEERLAFTTDSYVVTPLFFPGGNIGELAVYGTVNDLSMVGAMPIYLTAGFIIEEGFPMKDLKAIVSSMSNASQKAGVRIVAGDTKVVGKGMADGLFINTSGIGVLIDGVEVSASRIKKRDKVLISGRIGNHGIAVIAERNGITFDLPVLSDTQPLNSLVKQMLSVTRKDIHFMRDPTRGGIATTLKEAVAESGMCIRVREKDIPFTPQVKGACELLGIDLLYVANEGILIAIVDETQAEPLIETMRQHPYGINACVIGEVHESPKETVLLETLIRGTRIIEMHEGEQFPRIC